MRSSPRHDDDDDDDDDGSDDCDDGSDDDDDKCRELLRAECSCSMGQLTFKMQPTSPTDWISPSSSSS